MGLTAFNALRNQLAKAVDLTSGRLIDAPLDPVERGRALLVAPAIGGYRRPGSDWSYARSQVESYARVGLAGVGTEAARWAHELAIAFTGRPLSGEAPSARKNIRGGSAAELVPKARGAGD